MPSPEPKMAPPKAAPETIIWRYTSVHAFLVLIRDQTLMFHQFKKLQESDAREGMVVEGFWENVEEQLAGDISRLEERGEESLKRLLHFAYANCWNMAEYESALMWKAYAPGGIAIKTTVGDLENAPIVGLMGVDQSRETNPTLRQLTVEYADDWAELEAKGYRHDGIPLNRLFLHLKRNAFRGEAEVRFSIMPPVPRSEYRRQPNCSELADANLRPAWCPVTFGDLNWVKRIVAAPSTPRWAAEPIGRLCEETGIAFDISGI